METELQYWDYPVPYNINPSNNIWLKETMPFYDFRCNQCRVIFTKRTPIGNLKTKAECPLCGKLCPRTGFHPVPFVFKEKP